MHQQTSNIQLGTVLAAGKIWIICMGLVGVVAGVLLGMFWPQHYEAQAVMTVESTDSGPTLSMETEQLVASSTAVMTLAADELETSVSDVRASVTVSIPSGANALQFVSERGDPDTAAAYANALAAAYLDHVSAANSSHQAEQVQMWQERITMLEGELAEVPVDSSRADAITERLTEAERALLDLELEQHETDVSGTLVGPAQPPANAATPDLTIFVAGGLVAGVLLGMCCAVFFRRQKPVEASTDVQFQEIMQGHS